jgi:hypothetical protein
MPKFRPIQRYLAPDLAVGSANGSRCSKLGEAGFDEHDIFSPPSTEEKVCFDDTMSPIYDDYNDEYDIF